MKGFIRGNTNRILWCISIAVAFIIAIWLIPIPDNMSVVVEYSREFQNDFHAQLFWMTEDRYSEEKSSYEHVNHNKAELNIKEDVKKIQELRLDPMDICVETAITSIQIKSNGIGMKMLPVRELMEGADFNNLTQPEVTRGVLGLAPENDDPAIVIKGDMLNRYFKTCGIRFKAVLSIWVMAICMLLIAAFAYKDSISAGMCFLTDNYYNILRMILIVAVFLVAYMAFNSFDYSHPDEDVSKAAVDYYVNHWKPADIRSVEVADSFSAYGHSRLSEVTVYYFLAGKAAWLAKNILGLNKYYRAFNVLLFAILVGMYCKKGKKNACLFFMLGLTPQIWYLFSYATSDAWDYFLSFLILYQMTVEESLFQKAMYKAIKPRTVVSLGAMGVLYGTLLLGKKNYYFVLVASFLLLLYKLIFEFKKEWMQTVIKYGIILLVCLLVYGGVKISDSIKYSGHKAEIAGELYKNYIEKGMDNGNDLGAGPQGIWAGINMRQQGVELEEVLYDYEFGKYSYQSYAGQYGWMEYESSYFYYCCMGILYSLMFFMLLWTALSNGNSSMRNFFLLYMVLCVAVFGVSLWYSWTVDLQSQGRYLFPINFIVAICCGMYRQEIFRMKTVKLSMISMVCLAMVSFIFNGLFDLI